MGAQHLNSIRQKFFRKSHKNWKYCLIFLLLLAVYLIFRKISGLSIGCIFYSITGYLCPGCGTTRMIDHLLRREFLAAFWANPLVFLLSPVITGIWFFDPKNDRKSIFFIEIFCIISLLIFGILRNFDQFYFLRPR